MTPASAKRKGITLIEGVVALFLLALTRGGHKKKERYRSQNAH